MENVTVTINPLREPPVLDVATMPDGFFISGDDGKRFLRFKMGLQVYCFNDGMLSPITAYWVNPRKAAVEIIARVI